MQEEILEILVLDFVGFKNVDTEWYVRMSTNPPLVEPKVEMLLELCEEEGATLEATLPVIDNQPSQ